MLMIGNVGINRIRGNCSDFKGLRTIPQMIYQPHAFEATTKGYFYQRARESEKRLARRNVNGERLWPAKFSLWYFRPEGDCPLLGMISHLQVVSNSIVFMSQQEKNVRIFITPFNVFFSIRDFIDNKIKPSTTRGAQCWAEKKTICFLTLVPDPDHAGGGK